MNLMKPRHICKVLLLLAFVLPPQLMAADWTQWRGPNRDGISPETNLLREWPAGGPPLAWKATGLGEGYAAPAVSGGRIYGSGYRGEDEVAWALDAATGKEVWSTRIAPANRRIEYSHGPRATPAIDGDLLFVFGLGGNIACLETKSGKLIWTRDFEKDFGGVMMSQWGFSESPLVDGEHLICTPGGKKGTVAALNKRTGDLVWQSRELTDAASYSSLVTAEIGGERQYIVLTGESVAGIAPKDGRVLWRAERPGKTAVVPTPIVRGNQVWVTSGYNVGCNLFEVSRGSAFKVEQVYAERRVANHHGGAVLVGDHIYTTSGPTLNCVELATGKVVWRERSIGEGSIAYADGHLYLRSQNGPVALIEANPKEYIEKGRFDQPDRSDEKSWAHPVIAGGRLYLRDMDALFCYDVKKF
jgi:outer membrane protein assembly factor BamB